MYSVAIANVKHESQKTCLYTAISGQLPAVYLLEVYIFPLMLATRVLTLH